MTTTMGSLARTGAIAICAVAALTAMSESAFARWHGGCWGCGAFAAGAIAGAALSTPYVAPRYYYGGPVVVAPPPVVVAPPVYSYPVCPAYGPAPYYCR